MTKDNPRQGMSELLAKQRTGPPITPSEAARRRRSGRRGPTPDSSGTGPPEDRPVAGTQPPEMPSADEALAKERQATPDQPGEIVEATGPEADVKARTRVKSSRIAASDKGKLLAAACAAAVLAVCWLVATRRRQATALTAQPSVRTQLRDTAGKAGRRPADAARSAWAARRH